MRLNRVQIKNFRSIESLTIILEPTCRVLVGINESGKSNILKALSMLDAKNNPTKEDIRQILSEELPIKEANIRFIFKLNETEIDDIYKKVKNKILTNRDDAPLLKRNKNNYTLKQVCFLRSEGIYIVNIITGKRNSGYWALSEDYQVLNNWKKISNKCPDGYTIEINEGNVVKLKGYKLIDINCFPEIPKEYFEEITQSEINDIIGLEIKGIIENNLPSTIYWSYDEKNLLPSFINLNQFMENPDICLPLKYMFNLADYIEIKKEIEIAKSTSQGLRNLLERVARKTTEHFHNVWKEYKSIQFELYPNGANIDASIRDTFNHYSFAQRSDGFKRFVTFLLMISSQVKTNSLKDVLLLVDEPDSGLHPSGSRYLRDELIRISKTNYVVYSTHSIFMIDKNDIGRHLLIRKEKEKTYIKDATESNISEEEVIFNALGFSIYENLKEVNIIFEGWRDKRLFTIAMKRIPSKYTQLREAFRNVGICYSNGVKLFKSITPVLELADRKCIIISDDDKPAKEGQENFISNNGYGIWKTYTDLLPDCGVTGEDFVKPSAFIDPLKTITKKYPNLPELQESDLLHPKGKIYVINKWLETSGMGNERKSIIEEIKKMVFEELKQSSIEDTYYEFLLKLKELVGNEEKEQVV